MKNELTTQQRLVYEDRGLMKTNLLLGVVEMNDVIYNVPALIVSEESNLTQTYNMCPTFNYPA